MWGLRRVLTAAATTAVAVKRQAIAPVVATSILAAALATPRGIDGSLVQNQHHSMSTMAASPPPSNTYATGDDVGDDGGNSQHAVPSLSSLSSLHLVGQDDSVAIDRDLFETFSVDSLMELAGLSVAEATLKCFPPTTHPRVFVAVGPGNNGGDGLVAARHLRHFGYDRVTLFWPKQQTANELFVNLRRQNEALGNDIVLVHPHDATTATTTTTTTPAQETGSSGGASFEGKYDVVIDAVFGFSFKGAPREPFVDVLHEMAVTAVPVISVDVPSG